ncbi:MAG: ABC transporter substrate-binding protein [Anaerolineales bacterium]
MKHLTLLILLACLVLALPALAQDDTAAEFPVTVTDESGAELTFGEPVENVLCLSIACLDHLYQLGIEPAGMTDLLTVPYEQYFGEVTEDMTIIAGGMQPDIEQIAAMGPDLVVAQAGFFDAMRPAMENIAPMYLLYPTTVEDTISEVETLGLLTGRTQEAAEAAASFQATLAEYQGALAEAEVEDLPTTMLVFGAAEDDAMFLEAANGQTCLLLAGLAECPFEVPEDAGGLAAFGYDNFSFESILATDPEVIFFAGFNEDRTANDEVVQQLAENNLWTALSAVQNDAVYGIEPWMWRGGRGLTLMEATLEQALPILYSDIFDAETDDE